MEEYFKLRNTLKEIQAELQDKLEKILTDNVFGRDVAWFNFNNDTFIVIWTAPYLPIKVLMDLEKVFGRIDCLYTSRISDNIQIKFEKEQRP